MSNCEHFKRRPAHLGTQIKQRGLSLIELLVALTIGLLVIAAAIGTLAFSRGVSGTVSEASRMQQQAAYALRVIGVQVRQAGSIELTKIPGSVGVVFSSAFNGFNHGGTTVTGTEGLLGASDLISLSSERPVYEGPGERTDTGDRNCVGSTPPSGMARIDTTLFVALSTLTDKQELKCSTPKADGGIDTQPLIDDVAGFQVVYRIQTPAAGGFEVLRLKADEVTKALLWPKVKAVEICLDLQSESSNLPESGSYTNCNGESVARNGRLHLVFRNVFDLRTQGGA